MTQPGFSVQNRFDLIQLQLNATITKLMQIHVVADLLYAYILFLKPNYVVGIGFRK